MFSLRRARLANNEPLIRPAAILQNICLYFHDASQYFYSILNIESLTRSIPIPYSIYNTCVHFTVLKNQTADFQLIPSRHLRKIWNTIHNKFMSVEKLSGQEQACSRISQLFVLCRLSLHGYKLIHKKTNVKCAIMIMPICKTLYLSQTFAKFNLWTVKFLYIWMSLMLLRTATLQLCLCSPY